MMAPRQAVMYTVAVVTTVPHRGVVSARTRGHSGRECRAATGVHVLPEL